MANVAFIRPEIAALIPLYKLIRDVLSGETTVKAERTQYLPRPNEEDTSPENLKRYEAYVKRAVFYNVARRTLQGLTGQVFMRDPIIEVPSLMLPVVENASGSGVSLAQQAKKTLSLTLAYSRAGLLVDYPQTEEGATLADQQSGRIRPTITTYAPHEIINWRVIDRGAETILSLVVLCESYGLQDDGFEIKHAAQFRALRLNEEGFYQVEIWREPEAVEWNGKAVPRSGNFQLHEVIIPRGGNGQMLTEIPFMFVGSENNDPLPDNPNFYDLCSLNIAHYRNSADYEESCFITGQPTVVATGLSEEWVNKVLGGRINFGSRGGIPLPVGADAKLIQASGNTMIKEAMDMKERQMVALGAKLVEQKQVQRTAFEAKVESTSEGSTLSNVAKNVQTAYIWALEKCQLFQNVSGPIKFELNTDFDIARMTPEERAQVIKEWQAGALTFEEMRNGLRKAGVATEKDEEAKSKIAQDTRDSLALTSDAMGGSSNDLNGGQNNGAQ